MHTPAALIILAVWTIGYFYYDVGPYLHVLPVVAIGILVYRFVQRGRSEKRSDSNSSNKNSHLRR